MTLRQLCNVAYVALVEGRDEAERNRFDWELVEPSEPRPQPQRPDGPAKRELSDLPPSRGLNELLATMAGGMGQQGN